jgi:hypothetical protein
MELYWSALDLRKLQVYCLPKMPVFWCSYSASLWEAFQPKIRTQHSTCLQSTIFNTGNSIVNVKSSLQVMIRLMVEVVETNAQRPAREAVLFEVQVLPRWLRSIQLLEMVREPEQA